MYHALYRKYRPFTFDEVVGQKVIVQTLRNSLKLDKISHAYLFCGPRGTGKTTIAKLLARSVNCMNLQEDGSACGTCENCLISQQKECVDIIEIDAASNNGVDEIRELKNKVNLVPTKLKYKVYIIDEVHMLSIGAFNALLKTLEEPPAHIIFILATTDPQKVPVTILSRCQTYQFQKISAVDLLTKINEIVEKEKINIDDEVINAIVQNSDGCLRDTIGLLDKLSSYTTDTITMKDFEEVSGVIPKNDLNLFVEKIFNNDLKYIVDKLNDYNNQGKDLLQFTYSIITLLRDSLIKTYMDKSSSSRSTDEIIKLILSLNEITIQMHNSNNTKILLEIGLLQFIQSKDFHVVEKKVPISKNVLTTESEVKNDNVKESQVVVKKKSELSSSVDVEKKVDQEICSFDVEKTKEIRMNNTFVKASKQELNDIKEKWNLLNDYVLDQEKGYLICMLLDGTLRAASDEIIVLSYEYPSLVAKSWKHIDRLESIILSLLHLEKPHHLVFLTDDEWNSFKMEYVKNKSQNIEYSYIPEENNEIATVCSDNKSNESVQIHNNLVEKAIDFFGENVVEIK